jgi:hypothetical protein
MKQDACERCSWDPIDQVFDGYSVAYALAALRKAPRPAVVLPLEKIAGCTIAASVKDTDAHIDHVDARVPCIAVPYQRKWLIIDGNHRAMKQLRHGRHVRAYCLTRKEVKKVKTDDVYI